MKKQIQYLCDSGTKTNKHTHPLYTAAVAVKETATSYSAWQHVKMHDLVIHQPWYKRLEQHRK